MVSNGVDVFLEVVILNTNLRVRPPSKLVKKHNNFKKVKKKQC